jgi:cytochrome c oxidase subunit 3
MTSFRDIGKKSQGVEDFSSLVTHPYNIMLILLLTALTMAFLAISGAYLYTRFATGEAPIKVPIMFIINTFALVGSGYTLKWAKKCYENDDTEGYQKALLATLLLTLLFMALQFLGWSQLLANNPNLAKGNMRAYVYALSILHFVHIIGGLPFMLLFLLTAYKRMKEPVSVLVYFSDPLKRLKLKMLGMYWSFLEKLWIYIILFFWINYFISFK